MYKYSDQSSLFFIRLDSISLTIFSCNLTMLNIARFIGAIALASTFVGKEYLLSSLFLYH